MFVSDNYAEDELWEEVGRRMNNMFHYVDLVGGGSVSTSLA